MAGGSRWVRLDADYFTNPKVQAAGPSGIRLHLASICWSAIHLTDGHIPSKLVPNLCQTAQCNSRTVSRLVDAGLWIQTDGGDFYVKDYLDHQLSRGQVEREREMARQRQQRRRGGDGRFLPFD